MVQNTQSSALSSWVLLIARAIDSYGVDSVELFAEAGLDHTRLKNPGDRFSNVSIKRLWELAVQTTGDACFGLKVASLWHPTTLQGLGYSWFASNSLEEAYERLRRYSRFINTAANGAIHFEKSSSSYRVNLDPSRLKIQPTAAAIDAGLAMITNMSRGAYGRNFRLQRVTIQRAEPDCADRFGEVFRAPVEFSAAENTLWLDPEVVTEYLATANPELARVNDAIVTDYLARLDRSDLPMQVRSKLIERLPSGKVSEERIASSINVSQRSLQRKLREQGLSFTQLLENTRRELSKEYVRDPQRSLNEVAFLLGFAEPSNFSRAFKRWHGKSPSQYRQDSLS